MDYTHRYASPLGTITLASDGEVLTGLWFDGQKFFAAGLSAEREEKDLPIFCEAAAWLDVYFGGQAPDFTPALRAEATPLCRAVREILLTIPRGQTTTYGRIAREIAERKGLPRVSARAVGRAVGRNPVSLIVPCHRVVGADGALTGYAAGIAVKAALLRREGIAVGGEEVLRIQDGGKR